MRTRIAVSRRRLLQGAACASAAAALGLPRLALGTRDAGSLRPFPLSAIRLAPSPWLQAVESSRAYLVRLPFVLAADLGPARAQFDGPAPALVAADRLATISPVDQATARYGSGGSGRPADLAFAPFFSLYDRRTVYFKRYTPPEREDALALRAAERARGRTRRPVRRRDSSRHGRRRAAAPPHERHLLRRLLPIASFISKSTAAASQASDLPASRRASSSSVTTKFQSIC
jgi:hypothetical protein